MKKLALLMAVLMLAVAAFTVSAFEDVTVDDACFEAVNTLTSLEVIKGKTETSFAPNDLVTREQMAMLFTRLYTTVNFENGENMTPFTDLDDPYYNSVIAWCYDAKVINGTSPTTFEPKANIIYQDALTMACRLLGYTDLTYPLGNITKARLIGLTNGLEGVAYDKELTRGEVAIILYNALDANGAEIIKENKVKYYSGYPILESIERNFEIAVDVWNFKTETYQVVGTKNFNLAGYENASNDTSYNLVQIQDDEVVGDPIEMEFEDIAVEEGTDSDAAILAYIEILYRGDSLKDKKAVVLSSVINSDLNNNAEIGVYYKKVDNKNVAQKDKILVNGKTVALDTEIVYEIKDDGAITPVTDMSEIEVFWQEDEKEVGKYAQSVYDVNKDGEVDYIMFFPMSFQKVNSISSKGVYNIYDMATKEPLDPFYTQDEDKDNWLIINAEKVEKDDYVLTYQYGPFTVIEEVVEPVITAVTKRTGTTTKKFTLATGDVVTFAAENNPVLGKVETGNNIDPSNKEKSLYIVNGKIVYTTDTTTSSYEPYTYAFFLSMGEEETSVDTESGAISKTHSIIAYIDGKANTISVDKDSADGLNLDDPGMITVTDIKDGKYIVEAGMLAADEKTQNNADGYELVFEDAQLWYDTTSKLYKLTADSKTYIVQIDADSELYVETLKDSEYDAIKRYTMGNFPQIDYNTITVDNEANNMLEKAIIRENRDADNKVTSYTFVVGYSVKGAYLEDSDETSEYRIVLSAGEGIDKDGEKYVAYDVLNPVTGAVETITDTSASVAEHVPGTLVRKATSGKVVKVSAANEVFTSKNNLKASTESIKLVQVNSVIGSNMLSVYKGKNKAEFTGASTGTELIVGSSNKIVVIDIDENGDYVIETTSDITELEGKVIRTDKYKPTYIVVVPYEWASAAGFVDLSAYPEAE